MTLKPGFAFGNILKVFDVEFVSLCIRRTATAEVRVSHNAERS
jgi:hypothetical protein